MIGTVQKIADFYGVQLNKKELDNVVQKCGFPHMNNHTNLFNYRLPLNENFDGTIMKSGSMTRKGTNGDGKIVFSEEGR